MLTQQYRASLATLLQKIEEADAVVVGGAAGMSAAGYNWYQTDETFLKYSGKFADKYGVESIFYGLYHRFESREGGWAYIATLNKFVYDASYISSNPNHAVSPQQSREEGFASNEDIAHVLEEALNEQAKVTQ